MQDTAAARKRQEALRYMGYRGQVLTQEMEEELSDILAEAQRVAKPAGVHGIYRLLAQPEGFLLEGTQLVLTGRDICQHLLGAEKCALFAVTLGAAAERRILQYEKKNLAQAIMLDCALSAEIEAAVDDYEREIVKEAQALGYRTNWRFSPGYGDLPLTLQRQIGQVLNVTRTIGITVTESCLMIPRKSVTAVIGLFPPEETAGGKRLGCAECVLKGDCEFRRWGRSCWEGPK